MWGYGPGAGGLGGGPIFLIFWLAVIVALIAGAVWLARSVSRQDGAQSPRPAQSSALDILEARYARGDINRDEYLEKRRDLGR